MFQLLLVLVFCMHGILARGVFSDNFDEELDLWSRGVPGTPQPQTEKPVISADLCRKDILILLDASNSVTKDDFNNQVKPFLKKFINARKLNVAPNGTNIALITFSEKERTLERFGFGKYTTIQRLENYIDTELDWSTVSGGRTFTGYATELADTQIFTKNNPLNARSNIADVVLLVTDGEPRGRKEGEQTKVALNYTSSLKKKGVLIVGVAVGPERANFLGTIRELATSDSTVFDVEFSGLDNIIDQLIDASCTPFRPGDCSCPNVFAKDVYVKPSDKTVKVYWPQPGLKCKGGRPLPAVKTSVTPNIQSPHSFGVGNHDILYTYTFPGGFDLNCPVKIAVKSCTCPARVQTVVAYAAGTTGSTNVQWKVPAPSCGATLKTITPNKPSGSSFAVGSHTVGYVYATVAGFDLKCNVKIDVRACVCKSVRKYVVMRPDSPNGEVAVSWVEPRPVCPGQQIKQTTVVPANARPGSSFGVGTHTIAYSYQMTSGINVQCAMTIDVKVVPCQGVHYDPKTQMCCCGKLIYIKPGEKCCGRKPYDPAMYTCCSVNFNIVPKDSICPREGVIVA